MIRITEHAQIGGDFRLGQVVLDNDRILGLDSQVEVNILDERVVLFSKLDPSRRGNGGEDAGIEIQVVGEAAIGNLNISAENQVVRRVVYVEIDRGNGFQALWKIEINVFALELEAGIPKLAVDVFHCSAAGERTAIQRPVELRQRHASARQIDPRVQVFEAHPGILHADLRIG